MVARLTASSITEEREETIPTPDGQMTTLIVHPTGGGPFPVALVYMDAIGYRDQLKKNARRFAEAGYYVVVPDLFYRSGKGITMDMSKFGLPPEDPERIRLFAVISQVTPARVGADTEAIIAAIGGDPAAKAGAKVCLGYCLGARMALHEAAVRPDIAAAAGIHPGALLTDDPDSPHHDLDHVTGELYFAFAEKDRYATDEMVARFREEMKSRGVRGEVERPPGTAHGFAQADLPVYNREASERHFAKTLELWRRALAN